MKRALLLLPLTAIATACADRGSSSGPPVLFSETDVRGEREFVPVQWDSLWSVGGPLDSLLLNPERLHATSAGLFVYDAGATRVLAFDREGSLRWTYGRHGEGPDEIAGLRDMKVDDSGVLWVLDPANRRLTGISSDGSATARVPLSALDQHAEQFAPLPDGSFLLITFAAVDPLVRIDRAGRVLERLDLAWDEFTTLTPIHRQGLLVASGSRQAYLFSLGNGWFPLDLGRSERVVPYVEHAPFPRVTRIQSGDVTRLVVEGQPRCLACSAFIDGDTLAIHAGGRTGLRRAVIDRYDWGTGDYLNSYVLPRRAVAVARSGDRHYLLTMTDYPRITAYLRSDTIEAAMLD